MSWLMIRQYAKVMRYLIISTKIWNPFFDFFSFQIFIDRSIIRPSAVPLTPYEIEFLHPSKSFKRDYSIYPREKDVILASFHDANVPKHLFSSKYPGHQSMAIALTAIAKTAVKEITEWNRHTLDNIMIIGSKLHENRISRRQTLSYTYTLEIRHLPTIIAHNGQEICQVVYGNPTYGILHADKIVDSEGSLSKSLFTALSDCFLSRIQGVLLKIQGFCMAILRNEIGHWYIFDSYPKNIQGKFARSGKASLIKFCRCKTLTQYIENEFLWALPFAAIPVQLVLTQ